MKSLLVILSFVSSAAFAVKMEPGHYQGWDIDTQTVMADLVLNADQSLIFNLTTPDFATPAPGCTGTYTEVGNDVTSAVTCPMDFLPTANVRMDITNVDHDSIRQPDGVAVPVFVDALGSDPIIFKMKLIEAPVVVPVTPVVHPIPATALNLAVSPTIVFKENVTTSLSLKVQSELPGYIYDYEVENINTIVGASFNKVSSQFSWNVPVGTVPASDIFIYQNVVVVIKAQSLDKSQPPLFAKQTLSVIVQK